MASRQATATTLTTPGTSRQMCSPRQLRWLSTLFLCPRYSYIEIANGTDPVDPQSFNDFDNDQLPDYIDPDDDNDRIADFIESDADMNSDGIPNRFNLDSDGDSASDADEGSADVDGNNIPNFVDNGTVSAIPLSDQDNDGIADDLEGLDDLDQDGITIVIVTKSGQCVAVLNDPLMQCNFASQSISVLGANLGI